MQIYKNTIKNNKYTYQWTCKHTTQFVTINEHLENQLNSMKISENHKHLWNSKIIFENHVKSSQYVAINETNENHINI